MTTYCSTPDDLVASLRTAGLERGAFLSVSLTSDCVALAIETQTWVAGDVNPGAEFFARHDGELTTKFEHIRAIEAVEHAFRPRWVWWSSHDWVEVLRSGLRVATCWDLAAVHLLLFGGWPEAGRTD